MIKRRTDGTSIAFALVVSRALGSAPGTFEGEPVDPVGDKITSPQRSGTINGAAGGGRVDGGAGEDIIHDPTVGDRLLGPAADASSNLRAGRGPAASPANQANHKGGAHGGADYERGGMQRVPPYRAGTDGASGGESPKPAPASIGNAAVARAIETATSGAGGEDLMSGGAGDDNYYVDSLGDTISENLGEGIDTVYSTLDSFTLGQNLERLVLVGLAREGTGNNLDNAIVGNEVSNALWGAEGFDTIAGFGGSDSIFGGMGSDFLDGGSGDDWIESGSGGGSVYGGAGSDTILGGSGSDRIYGDDEAEPWLGGRDSLDGGDGYDEIVGGAGDDWISGGAGRDFIRDDGGFDPGNNEVWGGSDGDDIKTGSGNDVIYGDGLVEQADDGDDYVSSGAGDDNVATTGGNDTVDGGQHNDYVYTGTGNDKLYGGYGDDWLSGGEGDDELWGGSPFLPVHPHNGNDFIDGGEGNDRILAGTGNDYVSGDEGNDTLFGEPGDDEIYGGNGDDYISGGYHNDVLAGKDGDDKVYGDSGADLLRGDGGRDSLVGGSGSDTLNGGNQNDTMRGGPDPDGADDFPDGIDVFIFEGGRFGIDIIQDFDTEGGDVIRVDQNTFGHFAALQSLMREVGNDTIIELSSSASITLLGIRKSALAADDFEFV